MSFVLLNDVLHDGLSSKLQINAYRIGEIPEKEVQEIVLLKVLQVILPHLKYTTK
jgi:hypothetical protein